MEKIDGSIGGSQVKYEASMDNDLQVRISLVMPLQDLLASLAEKSGNPSVVAVEKFVVEMLKAYEASKVIPAS